MTDRGNPNIKIDRRSALKSLTAAMAMLSLSACRSDSRAATLHNALAELESETGGRLGVGLIDSSLGEPIGHRLNERFGMCSTFKVLLAAVILREAQEGHLDLQSPVHYSETDMVFYAPVTSVHLERGYMTVADLAEATQKTSDNPAANLLLDLIGGPQGFTEKLRAFGDTTTRLDRYELDMNFVPEGEVRDTTTPLAMASTLREIFTGTQLSDANKQTLRTWMEETKTGLSRLRAGFPADWRAGDKTGTGIAAGMRNKVNDVAVVWRADGSPLVVTAFFEADGTYQEIRSQDVAVLKSVGQLAAAL